MNKTMLCMLSAAALAPASPLAAPPPAFDAAWKAAVGRYENALRDGGVIGSSLYFLHDGQVIGARHYGHADRDSGRDVDGNTLYHWASITKTFTTVAVMQLHDRGLLSLDDPISKYLPEVRQVHNPYGSMDAITLRHLITHTSGFRSPTFPWRGEGDWKPHEPKHWWQVAAMMPYTEILFAPGSKYSYSNPGSSMLGRVVEIVSGDDIEMYITKNILLPLGMTRSYFDHTPYYLLKDRANNYTISDGKTVAEGLDFDTGATTGNGGLNGPVTDMIKWLNFWLGVSDNGHYDTVLARDTLRQMWQPGFPTDDSTVEERMGMHFFIIDHPAGGNREAARYIGHTGSQKSYTAFVYVHPETQTAAIYAANTVTAGTMREDSPLIRVRRDLMDTVFPLFWR
jgi:CubicO group peptidase (beta-lactamase class C family)